MTVVITGTPGSASGYPLEMAVVTQTITCTANTFVGFLKVPQGTIIHSATLLVDAGTASSTAAVGDTNGNTTFNARYITATSTAAAGVISMSSATGVLTVATAGVITAGPGYQYLAADTIGVQIAGASIAGVEYTLSVTYVRAFQ